MSVATEPETTEVFSSGHGITHLFCAHADKLTAQHCQSIQHVCTMRTIFYCTGANLTRLLLGNLSFRRLIFFLSWFQLSGCSVGRSCRPLRGAQLRHCGASCYWHAAALLRKHSFASSRSVLTLAHKAPPAPSSEHGRQQRRLLTQYPVDHSASETIAHPATGGDSLA